MFSSISWRFLPLVILLNLPFSSSDEASLAPNGIKVISQTSSTINLLVNFIKESNNTLHVFVVNEHVGVSVAAGNITLTNLTGSHCYEIYVCSVFADVMLCVGENDSSVFNCSSNPKNISNCNGTNAPYIAYTAPLPPKGISAISQSSSIVLSVQLTDGTHDTINIFVENKITIINSTAGNITITNLTGSNSYSFYVCSVFEDIMSCVGENISNVFYCSRETTYISNCSNNYEPYIAKTAPLPPTEISTISQSSSSIVLSVHLTDESHSTINIFVENQTTIINATDGNITITNLTGSTLYSIYVCSVFDDIMSCAGENISNVFYCSRETTYISNCSNNYEPYIANTAPLPPREISTILKSLSSIVLSVQLTDGLPGTINIFVENKITIINSTAGNITITNLTGSNSYSFYVCSVFEDIMSCVGENISNVFYCSRETTYISNCSNNYEPYIANTAPLPPREISAISQTFSSIVLSVKLTDGSYDTINIFVENKTTIINATAGNITITNLTGSTLYSIYVCSVFEDIMSCVGENISNVFYCSRETTYISNCSNNYEPYIANTAPLPPKEISTVLKSLSSIVLSVKLTDGLHDTINIFVENKITIINSTAGNITITNLTGSTLYRIYVCSVFEDIMSCVGEKVSNVFYCSRETTYISNCSNNYEPYIANTAPLPPREISAISQTFSSIVLSVKLTDGSYDNINIFVENKTTIINATAGNITITNLTGSTLYSIYVCSVFEDIMSCVGENISNVFYCSRETTYISNCSNNYEPYIANTAPLPPKEISTVLKSLSSIVLSVKLTDGLHDTINIFVENKITIINSTAGNVTITNLTGSTLYRIYVCSVFEDIMSCVGENVSNVFYCSRETTYIANCSNNYEPYIANTAPLPPREISAISQTFSSIVLSVKLTDRSYDNINIFVENKTTIINATAGNITITNLTGSTLYSIYVCSVFEDIMSCVGENVSNVFYCSRETTYIANCSNNYEPYIANTAPLPPREISAISQTFSSIVLSVKLTDGSYDNINIFVENKTTIINATAGNITITNLTGSTLYSIYVCSVFEDIMSCVGENVSNVFYCSRETTYISNCSNNYEPYIANTAPLPPREISAISQTFSSIVLSVKLTDGSYDTINIFVENKTTIINVTAGNITITNLTGSTLYSIYVCSVFEDIMSCVGENISNVLYCSKETADISNCSNYYEPYIANTAPLPPRDISAISQTFSSIVLSVKLTDGSYDNINIFVENKTTIINATAGNTTITNLTGSTLYSIYVCSVFEDIMTCVGENVSNVFYSSRETTYISNCSNNYEPYIANTAPLPPRDISAISQTFSSIVLSVQLTDGSHDNINIFVENKITIINATAGNITITNLTGSTLYSIYVCSVFEDIMSCVGKNISNVFYCLRGTTDISKCTNNFEPYMAITAPSAHIEISAISKSSSSIVMSVQLTDGSNNTLNIFVKNKRTVINATAGNITITNLTGSTLYSIHVCSVFEAIMSCVGKNISNIFHCSRDITDISNCSLNYEPYMTSTAPLPPMEISAVSRSSSSIVLSVKLTKGSNDNINIFVENKTSIINATAGNITITNLTGSNLYSIYVCSLFEDFMSCVGENISNVFYCSRGSLCNDIYTPYIAYTAPLAPGQLKKISQTKESISVEILPHLNQPINISIYVNDAYVSTERSFENSTAKIFHLIPGTIYHIYICAVFIDVMTCVGNNSTENFYCGKENTNISYCENVTASFIENTVPDEPETHWISSLNDSILLNASQPRGGVDRYNVQSSCKRAGFEETQQQSFKVSVDKEQFTRINISGLHFGTTCYINVTAELRDSVSSEIFLNATTKESVPAVIQHFTTNFTNDSTIAYQFSTPNPPNGEIIAYEFQFMYVKNVSCNENGDFIDEIKRLDLRETTQINKMEKLEINGLLPFKEYVARVRANTSAGYGEWSHNVTQTTSSKAAKAPNSVKAMENETCSPHKTVKVLWNPDEERTGLTNYTAEALDNQNNISKSCSVTGFCSDSCYLQGLHAYSKYFIRVKACTKVGCGSYEDPKISFTTSIATPGKVDDVDVQQESDVTQPRSLTVTWKASSETNKSGEIQGFVIRFKTQGKPDIVQNVSRDKTMSKEFVSASLLYNVTVSAFTFCGEGEYSEKKSIKINPGAPPKPDAVSDSKTISGTTGNVEDPKKQISIQISKSFLCNDENGEPVKWYVVVAGASEANDERFYGTRSNFSLKMRTTYKNWKLVQDDNVFKPYIASDSWEPCVGSEEISISGERKRRSTNDNLEGKVSFIVGSEGDCSSSDSSYCNGYLRPGEEYRIKVVLCTGGGCLESVYTPVISTSPSSLLYLIGIVFAALAIAGCCVIFLLWRKKMLFSKKKMALDPVEKGIDNPAIELDDIQKPIPLKDFKEHYQTLMKDAKMLFSEEFKTLKTKSPVHSCQAAEQQSCRSKNRYTNIMAYDHSRVKLLPLDDDEGSDYINANFIPGFNSPREYIACQGPLVATIDDFWRMVWEQDVSVIVMLTQLVERGRRKCDQYWPTDLHEPVCHGDMMLTMESDSTLPDYVIRVITLSMAGKTKKVRQIHYLKWPDMGCPETTWLLLNFVQEVRLYLPAKNPGPIVVHCSAGVGRTGTFIAMDYLIQQMNRGVNKIDIFGLILKMRDARPNMVQTEDQYVFIHECVDDFLTPSEEDEEEEEGLYANT